MPGSRATLRLLSWTSSLTSRILRRIPMGRGNCSSIVRTPPNGFCCLEIFSYRESQAITHRKFTAISRVLRQLLIEMPMT